MIEKINYLTKKYLTEKNTSIAVEILAVFTVIFFTLIVFANNTFDFSFYHNGDVHRGFHRGIDVWAGANSYETFKLDNMITQEKVPGFFPLYFYFMAFIVWLSDYSFIQFIDVLRVFIFIFFSSIGIIIYFALRKMGLVVAILGMSFFMFNRWTMFDVISLKQESYVLLLFLASVLLLKKNKYLAFLLFGFATGIKHLTILAAPLFFYDFYINVLKDNWKTFYQNIEFKKYLLCFLLFLAPIVLPSIPYALENPAKFTSSILFNITREPESDLTGDKVGLDKTLILYNQDTEDFFILLIPRIPMLIALILVNILLFKGRINQWVYLTLTYLCFMSFNPTLFGQYVVWFYVFVPFILNDIVKIIDKVKSK